MWPILVAALASHRPRGMSRDVVSALLGSGCGVLISTPPTLISAASISCAVPSPEEGNLLAMLVQQLAEEHRLIATVTVRGKRLRARFARLESVQEPQNGSR